MQKKCVCGSCIVISGSRVLLLWHEKLGVWLYPGGHMEENETPPEAAIREAKEETGMEVKILNTDGNKLMESREASELQRPFKILIENVPYKTGKHTHFDMVYLCNIKETRSRSPNKEGNKLRWVPESEIDGLETFGSVKWILHSAFSRIRQLGAVTDAEARSGISRRLPQTPRRTRG